MKFAELKTKTPYMLSGWGNKHAVVLDADTMWKMSIQRWGVSKGKALVTPSTSKRYAYDRHAGTTNGVLVLTAPDTETIDAVMAHKKLDAFVERVTSGEAFDCHEVVKEFFGDKALVSLVVLNNREVEGLREEVEAAREQEQIERDAERERKSKATDERKRRLDAIRDDLIDLGLGSSVYSRSSDYAPNNVECSMDLLEALIARVKA